MDPGDLTRPALRVHNIHMAARRKNGAHRATRIQRLLGAADRRNLQQPPHGPVRYLSDDERKAYEAELLARDGTPR